MASVHKREGTQRPRYAKGRGPKNPGVAAPLATANCRGNCWCVVDGRAGKIDLRIFYVLALFVDGRHVLGNEKQSLALIVLEHLMNNSPLPIPIVLVFDALAGCTQHCATLISGAANVVPMSRDSMDLSRRTENSWILTEEP